MAYLIVLKSQPCIEITTRCYTGCDMCYKQETVGPKKPHVPLETVIKRIDWINRFVLCQTIVLVGGEPLLHPDFIQIADYIISKGNTVSIITSGRLSFRPIEKINLLYALDLYEKGLLSFNLSYHPEGNDKQYLSVLAEIKKRYEKNREARKARSQYSDLDHDLFSTVVLDGTYLEDEKLLAILNFLILNSYTEDDRCTFKSTRFKKLKAFLSDYFLGENPESRSISLSATDDNRKFRHTIRFFGMVFVEKIDGSTNHKVKLPEVGTCDIIGSTVKDDSIFLPSLLVREDGDVVFSSAECNLTGGLFNADLHQTKESITAACSASLDQIKSMIYLANRQKALENCNPDGSEKPCTGCPFGNICTTCHAMKRPWQI